MGVHLNILPSIMKNTPKQIIECWMEKINTGDLEGVLSLYDTNAPLLPTFSARTLTQPDERREYFVTLSGRPNLQVSLHDGTIRTHEAEGTSVVYGIYTFRFTVDGSLLTFEARFTFVVDPSKESPILHHHSSQIPRGLM